MLSARTPLRRLKLIAALAAALFFLGSNVALACLCHQFSPTEAARNAASVFTGVARGRLEDPFRRGFDERVEFNVETVYKGDIPSRWSVTVNATDCAYVFSDGERYTVFATAEGQTNLCMGNVRGAIDPATYGLQAITVYPTPLVDFGRTIDRLALAALVAIALGTVAAIRTVRLRRARST